MCIRDSIDTRLSGVLTVSSDGANGPRLVGAVNTVGGQYRAYGHGWTLSKASCVSRGRSTIPHSTSWRSVLTPSRPTSVWACKSPALR